MSQRRSVIVQWRVKSQRRYLPASDRAWTKYTTIPANQSTRRLRKLQGERIHGRQIFEYRLKPA